MKLDLSAYANKKICVACSGGRDSMCLLHYLYLHGKEYGIKLFALNCDHGIRGEASARDSAFVKEWCSSRDIPLATFVADGFDSEEEARLWRHSCYYEASQRFGAAIATAHHLNDNAETVLFNLARGSALAGVCGISDGFLRVKRSVSDSDFGSGANDKNNVGNTAMPCDERKASNHDDAALSGCGEGASYALVEVIRPLICCSRADIDGYIAENDVAYVTDESNFSDKYTRNKIRLNILPELEKAVPGAAQAIYRFSRIAAEDEQFFGRELERRGIVSCAEDCAFINYCEERPLFNRAAVRIIKDVYGKKDYTLSHLDSLYALQFEKIGKIFRFLNLVAYKEQGRIALCRYYPECDDVMPFGNFKGFFGNIYLEITRKSDLKERTLRFDCAKIPEDAVIRTRRKGDKFTKFGGGTKSLGDFLTDKKIPLRLRDRIPLIASGSDVLAVCGVEISDKIRTDGATSDEGKIYCRLSL